MTKMKIILYISILMFLCLLYYSPESDTPLETVPVEQENGVKKIKYLLFWSNKKMFHWGAQEGFKLFSNNKCPIKECFMTTNRNLFGSAIQKFDAVLLFGPHVSYGYHRFMLPTIRYTHQKYIFISPESAVYYPICSTQFNRYYNWTATYKLDSDIQLRYFTVTDMNGTIVAPKKNPDWLKEPKINKDIDEKTMISISSKEKAAAIFVSNCNPLSRREVLLAKIQVELEKYQLGVDVFGACGRRACAKRNPSCDSMLRREYFFYLAFENSITEDYVTEKVLHGLKNTVVPIVFGGADYNRFLPPHSYIDASNISAAELAAKMKYIIDNRHVYANYFWWRNSYRISDDFADYTFARASCELCAMLHDEEKIKERSTYEDFRFWWSPKYYDVKHRC